MTTLPRSVDDLLALPVYDRMADKRRCPVVPIEDGERVAARDSNGVRWVVVRTESGLRRHPV